MRRTNSLLLLLVALALDPSPAAADLVRFNISGTLEQISGPRTGPIEYPDIGSPFSGSFVFDTAAADTNPSLTFGAYSTPFPNGVTSLSVDGWKWKETSEAPVTIVVRNNITDLGDSYHVGNSRLQLLTPGDPLPGIGEYWLFRWDLEGPSSNFDSTALPTQPFPLGTWTENRWSISYWGSPPAPLIELAGSVRSLSTATVLGRHLFYNNSKFDGNTPGIAASDDAAIAPDKSALLPGGTATFANYSSYNKGINGIALDIKDLPADLTSSDFDFKVSNNNGPNSWRELTSQPTILVRHGAGEEGSDRVELVWADGSILKEWLQITLKANEHTGLAVPDVFYFGNAVGESGNSTTNALVNAADEIGARNDPHTILDPAPITNTHDYSRDGFVNAQDQIIARNNGTSIANALRLIHIPPSLAAAAVPEPSTFALATFGLLALAASQSRRFARPAGR